MVELRKAASVRLLLLAVPMLALSFTATADVLEIPSSRSLQESAADRPLPARGQTRSAVERAFGAPLRRHPTVAGDRPLHPAITRWDYEGFYVVFENDHVITAVTPGRPTPVQHREQLRHTAP
jgi:hypothetical protein